MVFFSFIKLIKKIWIILSFIQSILKKHLVYLSGFTLGPGHRSMTYQNQKWPIVSTWSQSVTYRFFVDAVTKSSIDLLFFKMADNFFCQSVNDLWRQNLRANTACTIFLKFYYIILFFFFFEDRKKLTNTSDITKDF